MNRSLRLVASFVCSVGLLTGVGALNAQQAAVPPVSAPQASMHFAGMVDIAGHPADAGAVVQVEVIRSPTEIIACGEGTAFYRPRGAGSTAYDAPLNSKPECLNPDTTYAFYVNGVYATSARYAFSRNSSMMPVNVAVSEVALKTRDEDGLKMVWIYGTVKDSFGRPPAKGTEVTAKSRTAGCTGTGKTDDLMWTPKTPNTETFGRVGFYWIGIPMSKDCYDKEMIFDVSVAGGKSKISAVNLHTPPYGKAYEANLALQ